MVGKTWTTTNLLPMQRDSKITPNREGLAHDPLTDMFHANYDPPDAYEDEYAEGWKHARSQA